jgi:hypothetical protein
MSMMTTAQSEIAADLDAFAEVTWFTSAYMVCFDIYKEKLELHSFGEVLTSRRLLHPV